MDTNRLPDDWAQTTMGNSFYNEIVKIFEILIARTKTGEVVWTDSLAEQARVSIIKPCKNTGLETKKVFQSHSDDMIISLKFTNHNNSSNESWKSNSFWCVVTLRNEKGNVSYRVENDAWGGSSLCKLLCILRNVIIEQTEMKNFTFENFNFLIECQQQLSKGETRHESESESKSVHQNTIGH